MYDVELDLFCVVFIGFSSLFFVGGFDLKVDRCIFSVFSIELKDGFLSVVLLVLLCFFRVGYCVVLLGNKVYVIGGF